MACRPTDHAARAALLTLAPVLAVVGVAALVVPSSAGGAPGNDKVCAHQLELFTIEHKLHADLKLDRARVRCRTVAGSANKDVREFVVFRQPVHESAVRLDRITGRMVTLEVDRLPVPELPAPAKGWPGIGKLEHIARTQGELPKEATLRRADYIDKSDDGLRAGLHPYARLLFEHEVEGAHVIGDRIVARVDLRTGHLVRLDARRWTPVKAPPRRITEGRARKTAREAARKLNPADIPCCQKPHSGEGAQEAIASAMGSKRKRKRARRKGKRRSGPQFAITCEMRHKRRVYLHDRKSSLVEAYELSCVPTCDRDGVVRKCTKRQQARVYVGTENGALIGMKGALAPEQLRWQRPKVARRGKRPRAELQWRAKKILKAAILRVEPKAEFKSERCPPTEDDKSVLRRCWNLMLPAMRYRSEPSSRNIRFRLLDK